MSSTFIFVDRESFNGTNHSYLLSKCIHFFPVCMDRNVQHGYCKVLVWIGSKVLKARSNGQGKLNPSGEEKFTQKNKW